MQKVNKNTVAQVSHKTLVLENYIKNKKPGATLSYNQIENETGITMNNKGKSYLRTAFKRLKRIYSVKMGYGIKIAESIDTMPILVNKLTKINKAVDRADKTHKTLESQFFNELSNAEQKQVLFVGAVFGAIRVASDNGRLMYTKRNNISNSGITIPYPELE